jgi:hypothetical protein
MNGVAAQVVERVRRDTCGRQKTGRGRLSFSGTDFTKQRAGFADIVIQVCAFAAFCTREMSSICLAYAVLNSPRQYGWQSGFGGLLKSYPLIQ